MFPKETKIVRDAMLMSIDEDSIQLHVGDPVTIHADDGHYARASVIRAGQKHVGLLLSNAYQH